MVTGINFTTNSIKNVRKACLILGRKIGTDIRPNVSFDVAEINGKAFLSVQNLLTEKNKGMFLKLVKGKNTASILLAKGNDKKLKKLAPTSSDFVSKKLYELSAALKKAGIDEAKSLTDF